jgi:hypothetical protein
MLPELFYMPNDRVSPLGLAMLFVRLVILRTAGTAVPTLVIISSRPFAVYNNLKLKT